MAGAAREVSDANFEKEVLQSAEPVLVDFFAEWCGPCKAMAPALEQVASELAGKIKVAKLDVDQNPDVTQKYRIQASRCAGAEKTADRLDQRRHLKKSPRGAATRALSALRVV